MRLFRKICNLFNKEVRAYNKMHRKHRKELIKLAKADAEWDWCFLHDLIMTKIRHMYEYYSAGNCVWQSDETLLPTIDELKYVLDLQDELEHLFDNKPRPEMTRNENGSLTFTWTDEAKAQSDALYIREDEIYKEIYAYIGEHLRGWWD